MDSVRKLLDTPSFLIVYSYYTAFVSLPFGCFGAERSYSNLKNVTVKTHNQGMGIFLFTPVSRPGPEPTQPPI